MSDVEPGSDRNGWEGGWGEGGCYKGVFREAMGEQTLIMGWGWRTLGNRGQTVLGKADSKCRHACQTPRVAGAQEAPGEEVDAHEGDVGYLGCRCGLRPTAGSGQLTLQSDCVGRRGWRSLSRGETGIDLLVSWAPQLLCRGPGYGSRREAGRVARDWHWCRPWAAAPDTWPWLRGRAEKNLDDLDLAYIPNGIFNIRKHLQNQQFFCSESLYAPHFAVYNAHFFGPNF